MAKKTEAYVDTGAFIAFLDRSDTYHPVFTRCFAHPPRLVTTPLVIAEGHAWFLKRYDGQRALQFLSFVEDLSVLSIAAIDQTAIRESTRLLRQFSDQDLTITDASGLWFMRRHKIACCWSTDRHLRLLGATLIIHE